MKFPSSVFPSPINMKKTIQPLFLLLLLITFYNTASTLIAQEITGYEIIPENPSNADEVILIVHTSFPFLDCRLDSLHNFYACGAFAFDGFYGTGFEIGDCSRSDTVSMGVLPNGPYQISYRMYYLGWAQVDQIDTFITVGTTGLVHLMEQDEPSLVIMPIPARGHVKISVESHQANRLLIHDNTGRPVFDQGIINDGTNADLNVSLPPGMYICTAFKDGSLVTSRRFIILE